MAGERAFFAVPARKRLENRVEAFPAKQQDPARG
jgi:hypothetical protein